MFLFWKFSSGPTSTARWNPNISPSRARNTSLPGCSLRNSVVIYYLAKVRYPDCKNENKADIVDFGNVHQDLHRQVNRSRIIPGHARSKSPSHSSRSSMVDSSLTNISHRTRRYNCSRNFSSRWESLLMTRIELLNIKM